MPQTLTSRSAWGLSFCRFCILLCRTVVSPKWFIITHVWFELGTYKKIPQTLGSSVGHGRSFCKDLYRKTVRQSKMQNLQNDNPHADREVSVWGNNQAKCNTSCKTTNVVYLITCTKCGKQYVGETGDHVNQRMNGHRDDWKHKRFERSPVAEHFCSPEHDFLNHATLCCLDHNPEWTDRTRKARESYWIRRLNTLRPYGINKGDQ